MIIVTGGAGFIGSNLIRGLNQMGYDDILVVDTLKKGEKHLNLNSLRFADFIDYRDFISQLDSLKSSPVEAIFHQGACTNTLEYDGQFMMRVNYEYSKSLLNFACQKKLPFLYASSASVYGNGNSGFVEESRCEYPLNIYAYSKFLFDRYVRRVINEAPNQIIGLRYFNVYGPQENQKQKMASVIFQFHNQLTETNELKLFEGSDKFRRDFIYVQDLVDMNIFFFNHPGQRGIFNCGTGKAESFLKIGEIMQKCYEGSKIKFIPFPESLHSKYQTFTQADLTNLRNSGYKNSFTSLEDGISAYVEMLKKSNGYWV